MGWVDYLFGHKVVFFVTFSIEHQMRGAAAEEEEKVVRKEAFSNAFLLPGP